MTQHDDPERTFEVLFRCHYADVRAYVRRRAPGDRVEDLVAEIFLVAWRRRDRVPDDPLPWLYAVGRRVLSGDSRAARRRESLSARLRMTLPVPDTSPVTPADDRIGEALARLAPREREALMLVAWEGLTPAQAAVATGDSAGTFRVRLHRARRRMQQLLDAPTPSSQELSHDRSRA